MTDKNTNLRARAASGGRWTAVSAISSVFLQMAQFAILGRFLSASEFGLMAMMMVIIGLANSIADFGMGNFIVQMSNISARTFYKITFLVACLSIALSGIVLYSTDYISQYYRQPKIIELLPWLLASVSCFAIGQMLLSLLQRNFAFKHIAIGEISSSVLTLLVSASLAYIGYGALALVCGQVAAAAVRLLFFAYFARFYVGKFDVSDNFEFATLKNFAFYQTGERTLNFIGWNLDKVIIGRVLGDVGLGLYSMAFQLMNKPFSILNPVFTRVALPLFINIRDDDIRLSNAYILTIKTIALIAFPVYLFMAIASGAVIEILLGSKWSQAGPILYVLCILGMLFAIGNPLGTLILAKSKPKWAFYLNGFSIVVYIFAFWIGSHYSALGVAIAFLCAALFVLFPIEFYLRYRLVRMGVCQYLRSMGHLFFAAGLPLVLCTVYYVATMHDISVWNQILMGLVALLFYLGYLIVFENALVMSTKNLIFKGK